MKMVKLLTWLIVAIALLVSGLAPIQVIGIMLICYGAAKVAGTIVGWKS